jgi:hypothetical protein
MIRLLLVIVLSPLCFSCSKVQDQDADLATLIESSSHTNGLWLNLEGGKTYRMDRSVLIPVPTEPMATISIRGNGAIIKVRNGATLSIGDTQDKKTSRVTIENLTFLSEELDSTDAPLLKVYRSFQSRFEHLTILAAGRRTHGMIVTHIWGSTFSNCCFKGATYGLVVGTSGRDCTHMRYEASTFDHCLHMGLVLLHHMAGLVTTCSFEYNGGPGVVILSGAAPSSNMTVSNCYIFRNSRSREFAASAQMIAGEGIPGTAFPESRPVDHFTLSNNYIVGDSSIAVSVDLFCGLIFENNRVQAREIDVRLRGTGAFFDIDAIATNRNQSTGTLSVVDETKRGLFRAKQTRVTH